MLKKTLDLKEVQIDVILRRVLKTVKNPSQQDSDTEKRSETKEEEAHRQLLESKQKVEAVNSTQLVQENSWTPSILDEYCLCQLQPQYPQ